MVRVSIALAVSCLAVLMSGCADSPTPAAPATGQPTPVATAAAGGDWKSQAGAICSQAQTGATTLGAPPGSLTNVHRVDLPAWSTWYGKAAALLQTIETQLISIAADAADRDGYSAYTRGVATVVADYQKAQHSAAVGDLSGFQAAIDSAANDSVTTAQQAKTLGLASCAV